MISVTTVRREKCHRYKQSREILPNWTPGVIFYVRPLGGLQNLGLLAVPETPETKGKIPTQKTNNLRELLHQQHGHLGASTLSNYLPGIHSAYPSRCPAGETRQESVGETLKRALKQTVKSKASFGLDRQNPNRNNSGSVQYGPHGCPLALQGAELPS